MEALMLLHKYLVDLLIGGGLQVGLYNVRHALGCLSEEPFQENNNFV